MDTKWLAFFFEQRYRIFTGNIENDHNGKSLAKGILDRLKENKSGKVILHHKYPKLFLSCETYAVSERNCENTIAVTWVRTGFLQRITPLFFDVRRRSDYNDFFLSHVRGRIFPDQVCPICKKAKCTVEVCDKGSEHIPDKFPNQEQAFLFAHCLECGEEAREQEIRNKIVSPYKKAN